MIWLIADMIDRYFARFGMYVSLEIVKLIAAFTVSYLTLRWALLAGFEDFRVVLVERSPVEVEVPAEVKL